MMRMPAPAAQKADDGRDHDVVSRAKVIFAGATMPTSAGPAHEQRRSRSTQQTATGAAVGRIAADDEFEPIEGAGERRAESAGNAAGRPATDQNPQVRPPQPERHAEPRGDATRQLGVAGLETDRSARRPLDQTVSAATMMLPSSDMRPPCSALASIGSISRSGRQRAISSRAMPNDETADQAAPRARSRGSRRSNPDKRTPGPSRNSRRCSISTPVPIAATTKPATTPTSAASAIRLIPAPATMARRRRGISNRLVTSRSRTRPLATGRD